LSKGGTFKMTIWPLQKNSASFPQLQSDKISIESLSFASVDGL
jgi:hypothetical protein